MDMGIRPHRRSCKVTPADGDAGVPADAAIVVEFSEPMDRASVEAAYASQHLPAERE